MAALRDSLAITEQKLKAFEADLRSQEVQIVSDWQKLHDRCSGCNAHKRALHHYMRSLAHVRIALMLWSRRTGNPR